MSTFSGVATLTTTNSHAPGPFNEIIDLELLFTNGLSKVSLDSFPTISGPGPGQPPISTPLGNDTFTITLKPGVAGNGTGTFVPSGASAGKLVLALTLHLHNSVSLITSGDEDSDIPFTGAQSLTTETCTSKDGTITLTGSRYNQATGAITMVGATQFSGGFLGGSDCGLTITGTFSAPVDTPDFGNISGCKFWTGKFSGGSTAQILFYHPSDGNWWIGTFSGTQIFWALASNTQGFGNISGCQFWTGNFSGGNGTQILFYHPSDNHWWLGTFAGTQLSWVLAGDTQGFGNISGCQFWTANFSGGNSTQILFYHPSDNHWWLGTFAGTQLSWVLAGDTQGFGNISGCQFWTANFSGGSGTQILFYHPSDNHWFIGTFAGTQLSWVLAGDTQGFGNISGCQFWTGNFSGGGGTQILFYHPSDNHWFLGTFAGNQLSWVLAGDTQGFGNISGCQFWTGNFSGGNTQILFYHPSDNHWWLGTFAGNQLSWVLAGDTQGFGNISGCQFWTGDFSSGVSAQILFYHPSDGNWFIGVFSGTQMNWTLASNTGL